MTLLKYSVQGYKQSMTLLAKGLKNLPILVGGAGGYELKDVAPLIWKESIKSLAEVEI